MTDEEVRALARRYEVRIVPSKHGGYEVLVPQMEAIGERLITGGDSPEEALANGYEAIECVIHGRLQEGQALPEPAVPAAA